MPEPVRSSLLHRVARCLAPARSLASAGIGLAAIVSGTPAHACQGVQFEASTFMRSLPEAAAEAPVIARVEIVSVGRDMPDDWADTAEVRVLEAVRGVEEGQRLRVRTGLTSCSQGAPGPRSGVYFVAGTLLDGVLMGEWRTWPLDLPPAAPGDVEAPE